MGPYIFGCGDGWLTRKDMAIAKEHGAKGVNYTDPQCTCGYGCRSGHCRSSRRHWFTCSNLGHPHDQRVAHDVHTALANQSSATKSRRHEFHKS